MAVKHVTPEEFKKQEVKAGTKERFLVKVGELSTGSEIAIPVVVVRGKRDGPRVYIGAGLHAEETGSIDAVKRFGAQLTPDEVSGTIVIVPLQNAPAWAFRSRLYPLDAPTVGNPSKGGMSRGEPDGIMTARVLYALTDCIAGNVNFLLDIHSTHLDSMNYPFTTMGRMPGESSENEKRRMELCHKVGNQLIRIVQDRPGGLEWILTQRGCLTCSFEAGEGWRNLEPFPSIIIRGIRNYCKAVGALSGEPEMPQMIVEYTRLVEITVNRGGMSHLYVKPGQYVRKGQVVAEVRDMFDDVLEELKTPINGIVGRCTLLPTVATGARVCNVAETDRGEEWERRIEPELERQITLPGISRTRT